MAAGDFRSSFLFGVPGAELVIGGTSSAHITPPFEVDPERMEAELTNLAGATLTRVYRPFDVSYVFKVYNATDQMKDAIMSLFGVAHTHLSLVFADQWKLYGERYVCDTLTGFQLRSDPYCLHDQAYYNLTPTGTATLSLFTCSSAYAPSGLVATSSVAFASYDRATRRVTVTPTQTTAAVIYFDRAYNAALVKFSRPPKVVQSDSFQSTRRGWDVSVILKGV